MLNRLRTPFITRQLDADVQTLLHRGGDQREAKLLGSAAWVDRTTVADLLD